MAKNKNRKQPAQKNRGPQNMPSREQSQTATDMHETPVSHIPGDPGDSGRKQPKRYGHN
jgi:hypothetical protein